ncbi:palmitoyltransferase [Elysia marginata]|uniref:Palmitoyltransferase n=1 Tax=Elysia marginata TaxID=1093978 RepID=A0AAV4GMX1_9GAST|nr:palmitoyltransferase [Elysia marginata]
MSLCYNHFTSWNTILETALEPMFWIVDHSARYLGIIMVTLVVLLTTMVVMVTYICIFPHIFYQTDYFWSGIHIVFSHWLLINIVFNYVMAAFTDPGHPPQSVSEVVSICKKCIAPKPPRTHHCSICGKCVLKMDHHCRYDVFKQHFFGNKDLVVPAFFFPINMAYHMWQDSSENASKVDNGTPSNLESENDIKATLEDQFFHNAIIFEFVLCAGVSVALGLLFIWHARLVSMGQTSIELHVNNKERARLRKKNKVFKNPYDFGFVKNWQIFFGLNKKGRSFVRHILLPSRHDPVGDGITWETATFTLDRSYLLDIL